MNIQAEKIQLTQLLLKTDDIEIIRRIKAVFISHKTDLWDELDDEVKNDIDEAILQLEQGESIPHEKAFLKYKKWL